MYKVKVKFTSESGFDYNEGDTVNQEAADLRLTEEEKAEYLEDADAVKDDEKEEEEETE